MENSLRANISILIPDGENHLLKSVINGLAQVNGIKVYIMSNKNNIAMRYSRFVHKFSYYPDTGSDLDWIANIIKEIQKHDIDIVMPIWEVGVKVLSRHRDNVLLKDKLGLLPSYNELNTALNKWDLSTHMVSNNIPHPKSILLESNNDQLEKVDGLNFPIIIKPLEGFGGGHGIRKFTTKQAIENYFIKNKFNYPHIVQEYIEGYDIDCSVLCKEGNILAFTIQKGNMFGEKEFGPQEGLDFLYENELFKIVEKLIVSLNWSGVAHIDMRYDKNDQQYKIIEVNTRYWMSLVGSIIAGVNFPYLYCLASLGKSFKRPTYQLIKYLSIKGLIKMIKRDKMFLFRLDFIFNNTPLKFVLKDPIPLIYKLF